MNNSKIEWATKFLKSVVASFIEALPPMSNCNLKKNASLNLLLEVLNL
jgi:hypothetical protein